jgi:hypothetical protein
LHFGRLSTRANLHRKNIRPAEESFLWIMPRDLGDGWSHLSQLSPSHCYLVLARHPGANWPASDALTPWLLPSPSEWGPCRRFSHAPLACLESQERTDLWATGFVPPGCAQADRESPRWMDTSLPTFVRPCTSLAGLPLVPIMTSPPSVILVAPPSPRLSCNLPLLLSKVYPCNYTFSRKL